MVGTASGSEDFFCLFLRMLVVSFENQIFFYMCVIPRPPILTQLSSHASARENAMRHRQPGGGAAKGRAKLTLRCAARHAIVQ